MPITPINMRPSFKSYAAAVGLGALVVLSATAIHTGMSTDSTIGVEASCSGTCATGNATATTVPGTMQVGATLGAEPLSTTTSVTAPGGH